MQWQNISRLIENIQENLDQQGFFLAVLESGSNRPSVIRQQHGVVRTNCIDCLDRTNVVQGVIAQRALNIQLHQMGIFEPSETIQQHPDLVWFFKNSMWLI